jgi:hypothetical protein
MQTIIEGGPGSGQHHNKPGRWGTGGGAEKAPEKGDGAGKRIGTTDIAGLPSDIGDVLLHTAYLDKKDLGAIKKTYLGMTISRADQIRTGDHLRRQVLALDKTLKSISSREEPRRFYPLANTRSTFAGLLSRIETQRTHEDIAEGGLGSGQHHNKPGRWGTGGTSKRGGGSEARSGWVKETGSKIDKIAKKYGTDSARYRQAKISLLWDTSHKHGLDSWQYKSLQRKLRMTGKEEFMDYGEKLANIVIDYERFTEGGPGSGQHHNKPGRWGGGGGGSDKSLRPLDVTYPKSELNSLFQKIRSADAATRAAQDVHRNPKGHIARSQKLSIEFYLKQSGKPQATVDSAMRAYRRLGRSKGGASWGEVKDIVRGHGGSM